MAKQKQDKLENPESVKQLGDGKTSPKFLGVIKLPTTKRDRWLTAAAAVILFAVVLVATPYSRYGISGQFIKKSVKVDIADSRSGKPVSDVAVKIGPVEAKTNAEGEATLANVPVGDWVLSAGKKYYTPLAAHLNVPLLTNPKVMKFSVVALGNQVTIKIVNKITNKPVAKASLTALGATTTTDSSGQAVIVLPIQNKTVPGVVNAEGYNSTGVTIQNGLNTTDNFAIVPTGRIYYLSNATGTVDVVGSNLDGSSQSVVITGTGNEDSGNTQLLSARDWSYLALLSTRQANAQNPSLYLINTSTEKLSLIDQGNVSFDLIGWYDHTFVYRVDRSVQNGQPNGQAIKSYNADTGKLTTLFQTDGNGISYQLTSNPVFYNDSIVFDVNWYTGTGYLGAAGQQDRLQSVSPDGTQSRSYKTIDAGSSYIGNVILEKPNVLDFSVDSNPGSGQQFYQLTGQSTITSIPSLPINNSPTGTTSYLLSPSEQKTFWYEPRDGKNSLFTGDGNANNAVQVDPLSDYTPFGWYSDDYVLVSKGHSELFIAPADFSSPPIKISDYYSSGVFLNGYGGGYGGQ